MAQVHKQRSSIRERVRTERGNDFAQGGAAIALLYPSPYRAGMSSVGFQWVLKLLRDAGYQVERAFLPDDVDAWKKDRVPLYTYETERPVGHFPTIGVSLAYELELAGLIEALKLAGIPPLRRDRGPEHPRIVMGGPLTFSNPLPAAPFVDAMIMGEAEDVLLPAFEAAVHTEGPAWLDEIAALEGGYVPDIHGEKLPAVAKASDARRRLFYFTFSARTARGLPPGTLRGALRGRCALDRADDEKLRTSPPNHDVPVPDDGVSVELVRNSGCCGC